MTDKAHFPAKPGPCTIYDCIGKPMRRSQNLAAVLRHATKTPINVIEVRSLENGMYGVAFFFDNRDYCLTTWSDWRVVFDWLLARRSWSVERISVDHDLYELLFNVNSVAQIRKRGTLVHRRATPHSTLRHHVTGAIERGEKQAITEMR